jgi:hypothetical protein
MPMFHLSWSTDDALLVSADMRGRVKLWNASAAAELRTVGIEEGAKGYNDLVLDPMGAGSRRPLTAACGCSMHARAYIDQ